MIDIRIVGVFLLISAFLGIEVLKIPIPDQLRLVFCSSAGAFIGLCLAFIDERRKK